MSEKTELQGLQERATLMGIKFHPNSKEESLRAKINAVLDGKTAEEVADTGDEASDPVDNGAAANSSMPDLNEVPGALKGLSAIREETPAQRQQRLKMAGTKLIRVYVHCNNPMKSEWQGEQFTISNRNIGTISRFVPFDQEWHVEQAILDMMRDRQFLQFAVKKRGPMQLEVKEPKYVREFNVEILEPLTAREIKELAIKQALQGGDASEAVSDI